MGGWHRRVAHHATGRPGHQARTEPQEADSIRTAAPHQPFGHQQPRVATDHTHQPEGALRHHLHLRHPPAGVHLHLQALEEAHPPALQGLMRAGKESLSRNRSFCHHISSLRCHFVSFRALANLLPYTWRQNDKQRKKGE